MKKYIKALMLILAFTPTVFSEGQLTISFFNNVPLDQQKPLTKQLFVVKLYGEPPGDWYKYQSNCNFQIISGVTKTCTIPLNPNLNEQSGTFYIYPLENPSERMIYWYKLSKVPEAPSPIYNWYLSKEKEDHAKTYTVEPWINNSSSPCVFGESTFDVATCDRSVKYTLSLSNYGKNLRKK